LHYHGKEVAVAVDQHRILRKLLVKRIRDVVGGVSGY